MIRQYVAPGSIDVAIVDPPYFLRTSDRDCVIDFFLEKNGDNPRFNETWDRFSSIPEYEEFCSAWIDEVTRCLAPDGSIFIFGVFTSTGLINRLLHTQNIWINNHIAWIERNSRPHLATRRLKPTHETIIWAAKAREAFGITIRNAKRRTIRTTTFPSASARCPMPGYSDAARQRKSLAKAGRRL
jgi:modification methylase